MTLAGEDRGVSPVFGYTLTLTISTLLIAGLIVAAGGYLEDQRERTARSELRVLGQQVSSDIAAADRLNRTGDQTDVVIERTLPERVVGSQYRIAVRHDVNGPTSPYLELNATAIDVSVEVGLALSPAATVSGTAGGGQIEVRHNGTGLEVSNA